MAGYDPQRDRRRQRPASDDDEPAPVDEMLGSRTRLVGAVTAGVEDAPAPVVEPATPDTPPSSVAPTPAPAATPSPAPRSGRAPAVLVAVLAALLILVLVVRRRRRRDI